MGDKLLIIGFHVVEPALDKQWHGWEKPCGYKYIYICRERERESRITQMKIGPRHTTGYANPKYIHTYINIYIYIYIYRERERDREIER